MAYLLLLITVICNVLQSLITKQYNLKVKRTNTYIFVSIISAAAAVFFGIAAKGRLNFRFDVTAYSVAFAAAYAAGFFGMVKAIEYGPLSISALIIQFSLLIPTLFGIIILDEKLKSIAYIGIVFLLISLILVNAKNEEMKISGRWVLWETIGFIGNGMCSVIQKMQQMRFDGGYKSEFMMAALLIVAIVMFALGAVKSENIKNDVLCAIKYGAAEGVANGIVNLAVMVLTGMLATSVIFPTISAGGMAMTFVLAAAVFKEKLNLKQIIGYILGIAAVLLLNI